MCWNGSISFASTEINHVLNQSDAPARQTTGRHGKLTDDAERWATDAMREGHERTVLAAMMNGSPELPVTAEDFYSPPNRTIALPRAMPSAS